MHKNTHLIALIILASTITGCSKFRELTRKDYAQLKDPFLDRSAVAEMDDEEKPAARSSLSGTSGVVAVADLNPDSDSDSANAMPASHSRPNTTGKDEFAGIRVRGLGDVISTEVGPSRNDFAGKTAAADSPDMEEFAEFVKGQAVASGMTETAKNLDEDMNELFARQYAEWNQKAQVAEERAIPLIGAAREAQAVAIEPHPEMPSLPELGFGNPRRSLDTESEVAKPLIQSAATTQANWVVPTPTTPEFEVPAESPLGNASGSSMSDFGPDPFAALSPDIQGMGSPPPSNITPMSGVRITPAQRNPLAEEFGAALRPKPPTPKVDAPNDPKQQWNSFSSNERKPVMAPKPTATTNPFDDPFRETATPKKPVEQKPQDSGFNFDTGWRASE
jgi:hypothetical protein